jgi:hypothetical protein
VWAAVLVGYSQATTQHLGKVLLVSAFVPRNLLDIIAQRFTAACITYRHTPFLIRIEDCSPTQNSVARIFLLLTQT